MKKFIRTPRALLLGVSALAVVLVGAGVASGTIGAKKPNVYWACVPKDGRIKLVYPGSKCKKGERFIKWHQSGLESATVVKDGQQGAKGENGAQGPAGSAGPQGPAAPKGDAGANGAKGADGAAGPKGDAGANGAKGADGAAGPKGDTGGDGPQGPAGPAGPTGDTGAQGPQGLEGDKGDKGDKGDTGATGPEGPQGPAGASGSTNVTVRTKSGGPDEEIAANCVENETAVGGGVSSSQTNREVVMSRPDVSSGTPKGWIGRAAGSASQVVTVYVLCAS